MNIEIIPVTAFQQNCSLIWDDDKNAAIIDPGGEVERLIQRIEELDLNLKVILLTHGHLDHVGAAMQFGVLMKKINFYLRVCQNKHNVLVCQILKPFYLIVGLIKKVKS